MDYLIIAARVAASSDEEAVLLDAVLEGKTPLPFPIPDSWNINKELRFLLNVLDDKNLPDSVIGMDRRGKNKKAYIDSIIESWRNELGVSESQLKYMAKAMADKKPWGAINVILAHKGEPWTQKFAEWTMIMSQSNPKPVAILDAVYTLFHFPELQPKYLEEFKNKVSNGNAENMYIAQAAGMLERIDDPDLRWQRAR